MCLLTTSTHSVSKPEALDGAGRRRLQGLVKASTTLESLAYCTPRLLLCVLQATDVYAMGVLLWEMFYCLRAWPGMSFADIVQAVAVHQRRLPCTPDMPLLLKVSSRRLAGLTPDWLAAAAVLAAGMLEGAGWRPMMPASICRYMSGTILQYRAASNRGDHLLNIIVQPADGNHGLPACCIPPVQ